MVSVKVKKKSQEYETKYPTYNIPIHFFSLECPAWTLKKKRKKASQKKYAAKTSTIGHLPKMATFLCSRKKNMYSL